MPIISLKQMLLISHYSMFCIVIFFVKILPCALQKKVYHMLLFYKLKNKTDIKSIKMHLLYGNFKKKNSFRREYCSA